MPGMQDIFAAGLFPQVLANFTEPDAAALCSTCRSAHELSGAQHLPPDFAWRTTDNLEEALARIRETVDFGYAYSPWSGGCLWQQALLLFARFLHSARAAGVLRVEVERGCGVLAWKRFSVAEGSELEWRARVLKFAQETGVFHSSVMKRYKYTPARPTQLVFQLLEDLGFQRRVMRGSMPMPAGLPEPEREALRRDRTYFRRWQFSGTATFDADIRAEWGSIERKRTFFGCVGGGARAAKRANPGASYKV
jgi:hypothetical protein